MVFLTKRLAVFEITNEMHKSAQIMEMTDCIRFDSIYL